MCCSLPVGSIGAQTLPGALRCHRGRDARHGHSRRCLLQVGPADGPGPVSIRAVTAPIMPGAEPWSAEGGPNGVLVLHGFTGNPQSMRPVGRGPGRRRLHRRAAPPARPRHLDRGHGPDPVGGLVRRGRGPLPGAGRPVRPRGGGRGCRWADLTCWLAERHPHLSGIALVNPLVHAARRRVPGRHPGAARRRHRDLRRHRLGHQEGGRRRGRLPGHPPGRRALAVRGGRRGRGRARPTSTARSCCCRAGRTTWSSPVVGRRRGGRRVGPRRADLAGGQLPRGHPRQRRPADRGPVVEFADVRAGRPRRSGPPDGRARPPHPRGRGPRGRPGPTRT